MGWNARLQATLVNAVDDGELAEERLAEAAGRVAEFAVSKGTDACRPRQLLGVAAEPGRGVGR